MILTTNISTVYNEMGFYDEALECLLKCFSIQNYHRQNDTVETANICKNIGFAYKGKGHLSSA